MTDIKIKKSIIKGWDWNSILAAHFPKWFHEEASYELCLNNISGPYNGATVFPGRKALQILESAAERLIFRELDDDRVFEDGIRDRIRMVRVLYRLRRRETRIII